jgi:outer membrane protein OmpA-like peptidoglycan-associated protein
MRLKFAAALALAATTLTGCATHKWVNKVVDEKVAALDAKSAARFAELDQTSRDALSRAIAAGKLAEGKFVYSVVLSDDSVKFASGKAVLSDEAKTKLAAFAAQLKSENKNVYLEVQGHTDSVGSDDLNRTIGQKRAEAVRLFLNQNGVALNRMAAISYGEDAPVVGNTTKADRAANRRVVIVVLN